MRSISPIYWLACGFLVWVAAFRGVKASAPRPEGLTTAGGISTPVPKITGPQAQVPPPAPRPGAPAPKTSPSGGPPVADAQGFIGEAACVDCHDEQKSGYFDSNHHRATDPRTPGAKQSCETCHGPAGKHATDDPVVNKIGRDFTKMKPAEITAVCTTCHNRGEHALWDGSQHERRGLSCTTCHAVHSYKSEHGQLIKKNQLEVCATCHRDKVSKIDRSGHMPVREGKMQCTTCHNTHGSTNVKLLRKGDSVAELCTSCHADKRGPYLWEHAPSRDGCPTCHDPHGSPNERMLVAKPPILCQRCHVGTRHPATIYDAALVGAGSTPNIRVYARSCVICHAAIHGSNHPSGQRFIR
jgi:DmsE family decaheme c-type cytochrome